MKSKQIKDKAIFLSDPMSPTAEAYRTLRTNIQIFNKNKQLKSLMVTSAQPHEGTSTIVSNLAIPMVQTGQRILLIDGNLRKPAIHHAFRLSNQVGLASLLNKEVELDEVVQEVKGMGLKVITAGPAVYNPAELLSLPDMRKLLEQLQEEYDMVLLDTPPVLPVSDGLMLAGLVDAVLLVIRSGKVLEEYAKKAKALLENAGANVLGTVLNNKKLDKKSIPYS